MQQDRQQTVGANRSLRSLRPLLTNSAYLFANTVAGSLFGFAFWTVAALNYDPAQVGIGAAFFSALSILAVFGQGGLGIALIRHLPLMGPRQTTYFNTSAQMVAAATVAIGLVFSIGSEVWAPDLGLDFSGGSALPLFLVAAVLYSLSQLLDQLFIALQAGQLLLLRGVAMHLTRVLVIALPFKTLGGLSFLLALAASAATSVALGAFAFVPRVIVGYRPWFAGTPRQVSSVMPYALANLGSQVLLTVPRSALPLLVAALLGPEANAYFYVCWMIANTVAIFPNVVATSAFARLSAQSQPVRGELLTIAAVTTAVVSLIALLVGALSHQLLAVFGSSYVEYGGALLIVLVVAAIPYAVVSFGLTHFRADGAKRHIVWLSAISGMGAMLIMAVLAVPFGLQGIGVGWLAGQIMGAVYVLAVVLMELSRRATISRS